MRPLLEALSDGREHVIRDVYDELADRLGLTDLDRQELDRTGSAPLLHQRVRLVTRRLVDAGLLESPRPGVIRITEGGRLALRGPRPIDSAYLEDVTPIPPAFLRGLIAIGASQDFAGLTQLFEKFPPPSVSHFMRKRPEFWFAIADSLSEADLEALIRALTVAERDFPEFGSGSTSGVIWTFHRLKDRTRSNCDGLADWILAHTTNFYAPFSNHGARSLAELAARTSQIQERRTVVHDAIEVQRLDAVRRRGEKATREMFGAIRRKDAKAIKALLGKGARIDVPNDAGITALAYAEQCGHMPILSLLQEHAAAHGLDENTN